MKRIYFVTRGYPTPKNTSFAFIQPIIQRIADQGIECVVIAPQTVNGKSRGNERRPFLWKDRTPKGNEIRIYQPEYYSFGKLSVFGVKLTTWFREKLVEKVLKKLDRPDAIYAHFWDCAFLAAKYCSKTGVPLIAVTGESEIRKTQYFSEKQIGRRLPAVKGVISVSSKNLAESKKLGLIQNTLQSIVLPNAIDTSHFYPVGKHEARSALGIDDKDFVVSFVGRFSERKGVNRVIEAVKSLSDVKLILVGYGGELEESDQIVFSGRVPHDEVYKYLNASDVYCLPTLAEGCCNSIVEAMACALPIISSDADFNDDILDDSVSIRVDPTGVSEISQAIKKIMDDPIMRAEMASAAITKAQSLTIEERVDRMLVFIETVIDNQSTEGEK